MATFVTSTGFNKKILTDIKSELEKEFKEEFGEDIDIDSNEVFGQIIGILAKREADLWDLAEEIYHSIDPNQASGKSLDSTVSLNAITRLPSTPTFSKETLIEGDEGTTVISGKLARQKNTTFDYSLDTDVTISKETASKGAISVSTVTAFNTYTVTINLTDYDYVAGGGDDELAILNGLKTLIEAGSWTGTPTVDTEEVILILEDLTVNFSFDITGDLEISEIWVKGDFTSIESGPNTLPANSLTEIQTPVSGWNNVNNPSAGITGRNSESDSELRIRRERSVIRGSATDVAIRASLLNETENVISAKVTSNRTLATDIEGRPPKSFECVVQGGLDADIANTIWVNMPSGIESYGNTTVVIADSQGVEQTINFSRPITTYIHVELSREKYPEEIYPTNGDELIKQAIVDWSLDTNNIDVGVDVIPQRLSIPIYSIPGIGEILILIDGTPNPGDVPSFSANSVVIDGRHIASFSIDRIAVQDLP